MSVFDMGKNMPPPEMIDVPEFPRGIDVLAQIEEMNRKLISGFGSGFAAHIDRTMAPDEIRLEIQRSTIVFVK